MKKYFLRTIVLFFIVLSITSYTISKEWKYDYLANSGRKISYGQIEKMDPNKKQAVIIGSKKCPDCLEEMESIYGRYKEKNYTILYLDCALISEVEVKNLDKKYGIRSIPAVLVVENGRVNVKTTEDIMGGEK